MLFLIDIRNWFSNIEQHASEGVNKILIGNKCDMPDKKVTFVEIRGCRQAGSKVSRGHFYLFTAWRDEAGQHYLCQNSGPSTTTWTTRPYWHCHALFLRCACYPSHRWSPRIRVRPLQTSLESSFWRPAQSPTLVWRRPSSLLPGNFSLFIFQCSFYCTHSSFTKGSSVFVSPVLMPHFLIFAAPLPPCLAPNRDIKKRMIDTQTNQTQNTNTLVVEDRSGNKAGGCCN